MINNLLIAFYALTRHMSTSHSVDEILLLRNVNLSTNFRGRPLRVEMVFFIAFDSIHRGKREKILLSYGLPKETATARMMPYRNMKAKAHSPDGDTDFVEIVVGVLQGDTFAPYLFITC